MTFNISFRLTDSEIKTINISIEDVKKLSNTELKEFLLELSRTAYNSGRERERNETDL